MSYGSYVTYKITGNKDELKNLKKMCDLIMSKHTDCVSFIYLYEKYKYDYKTDWKTKCWIDEVSLEEGVLTLDTQYDCCLDDCFYKFLQKTYPNLNVIVDEFSPVTDLYQTNDKDRRFFKDKYMIISGKFTKDEYGDGYTCNPYWDFFENEEDLIKFVREFSEDDKINNMEDVLNYIKELDDIQEEKRKRNGNMDNDKLLTLIEKEIIDLNKLLEYE